MLHPFCPPAEDMKSGVRLRSAIQVQAMSIETPGQRRIVSKPAWIGQGDKIEAEFLVRRIGLPKALIAPEVRQTRIDSHAGAGADQESLSAPDRFHRTLHSIFVHFKSQL
jgi:hypothetical protein